MLNLDLKDGGKLDIPPHSLIFVEERMDEEKGCVILYSLQPGVNHSDELTNNYGFVMKKWREAVPSLDRLEVTVAAEKPRKISFPSSFVLARRELKNHPHKAQTQISLDIGGTPIVLQVLDKRETLLGDGEE